MPHLKRPAIRLTLTALLLAGVAVLASPGTADAQVTAYKQAVAEASYGKTGSPPFTARTAISRSGRAKGPNSPPAALP